MFPTIQVLLMLNGVSSPGPAFQMDPVDGLYSVTPGCHMQSISQGGTQTLLQSFAELGSILWRVRKFCTSMMSPSAHHQNARVFETSEWTSINPEMSFDEQLQHRQQLLQRLPTVAAFAAALDFELKVCCLQKYFAFLILKILTNKDRVCYWICSCTCK